MLSFWKWTLFRTCFFWGRVVFVTVIVAGTVSVHFAVTKVCEAWNKTGNHPVTPDAWIPIFSQKGYVCKNLRLISHVDDSNYTNHHMNHDQRSEWDGYDYLNEKVWPETIICFTRTPATYCDSVTIVVFTIKHPKWTPYVKVIADTNIMFFMWNCFHRMSCQTLSFP